MVEHQPLQLYEKQPLVSLVTGIYGCRWKRYQRSQDESSTWECTWFLILCTAFLLLLFWVYFWLVAQNDFNEFNWCLYNRSGEWVDQRLPVLWSTAAAFSYVSFLTILALLHLSLGQQLHLFWLHKVGVSAAVLATVCGVLWVRERWGDGWAILALSLQSAAPFLHILALACTTAGSWLVAGYAVRRQPSKFQRAVLLIYALLLSIIYVAPLTFTCPCIMDRHRLKARPAVVGRRGAPMLAPENTLMSFSRALQHGSSSVEADVSISLDGVPFLIRDHTLRRTTDVRLVFPDRQRRDASFFNWTQIRSLNAGRWFLESDPYWTVRSLTARERRQIGTQTVCSLVEMLRLVARANSSALINVRRPPPGHPRTHSWFMDTLGAVQQSGVPQRRVTWFPDTHRGRVRGLHMAANERLSLKELRKRGITSLTLHYSRAHPRGLQEYLDNNVSVTVFPVNQAWLYSLLWCSGVSSVSSDAPQVLLKVSEPIWLMSSRLYQLIWVASDLLSLATVAGLFCYRNYHMIRWRMGAARRSNPEWIVLKAVRGHSSQDVGVMKERLLLSGDLTVEPSSPEEAAERRSAAAPAVLFETSAGLQSSITAS